MKVSIGATIVTAILAVSGPAAAASAGAAPSKVEIRTAGSPAVNSTATDIGARRYHRRYYRYGYRPYYRPYPYYYARPYYYRPYPYYAPAPFPLGFGFGFGPWGW